FFFFFQAEDGIRDFHVTGVQTCALPIYAFLLVNDRSINTVAKAAGKKIAVLDYDEAQKIMVQQVGAQAVSADVTNFGAKFNNGRSEERRVGKECRSGCGSEH